MTFKKKTVLCFKFLKFKKGCLKFQTLQIISGAGDQNKEKKNHKIAD